MTSKVRLSDVARHAHVSTATVSRVLNGKRDVSDATRHAVLAAMDMLGYARPTPTHTRSGGLIGLIVPELSNPVFPMFAQEIEHLLTPRGYTSILCTQAPGGISEDDFVSILLERQVSGIVFVSGLHADLQADPTRYQRLANIPFVTINGYNPQVAAPSFSCDEFTAAARAVDHLVDLGHTRIGLAIGPQRFVPTRNKIAGYQDAMTRRLPNQPTMIVDSLFTLEGGQAAAAQLMTRGATAIIAASDLMALGAIEYVRSTGLSVPEDVSVIGFDDSPLVAYTNPPLTTIRHPVRQISRAAVSTLLQMMAPTPPAIANTALTFTPELIARGSTSKPPVQPT